MRSLQPGRVIIAVLLLAGLFFGLTRAGWITADALGLTGGSVQHVVSGQQASPAVAALIAVVMAAALAAGITRGWVRTAIAAVAALCAAGAAVSILPVLLDPAAASRGGVADQSGVIGQSISAQLTPWPYAALLLAALLTAACVLLALISRRTPARSSDRYARTGPSPRDRSRARTGAAADSPRVGEERSDAADWDALSRGEDPS